jgi:putative endonuclease
MKEEMKTPQIWSIYLLECSDGSFYAGITNNLEQRLITHNAGLGAKYTRGRTPVKLLEFKEVNSHSEALQQEYQLKKLPKSKKRSFFN